MVSRAGKIVGYTVLVIVLAVIVGFAVAWLVASGKNYERREVKPGMTYTVGERTYKVPDLPLKSKAYFLKEEYLLAQRELFLCLTQLLDNHKIEHWCSGGTLLGFIRHGTVMPWDDDLDMHTHADNRQKLFSPWFGEACLKVGLKAFRLAGTSAASAPTREGGGVRVKLDGRDIPVCDIFFVDRMEKDKDKKYTTRIAKIDSWTKRRTTFNKKERWKQTDLFPIQKKDIDDMKVPVPANPKAVLEQQYGPTALTEMYGRPLVFSHEFVFSLPVWREIK